ncbi:MAG: alpha/beta hydrolase [Acidobacteria bacterium]|nr:alpha/beta hydrolase [Acidobacteriota bacterium]
MSERHTAVAGVLIASIFIGCAYERNIGAAVPSFDLEYRDYSWMTYLADAGFDVFAMDLQGYGSSSKPAVMDDPYNVSADAQSKYLVPNPLRTPCQPRYPHSFGSFATDWDEIDTVGEFIRSIRGDRALKVNLVGWSRGAMRVIGYAALRPDSIERVVALASTRLPPLPTVPSYPMHITDMRDFFIDWDRQIDSKGCPQQVDPWIRQALWNSTIALDKLGSGWGASGVRRSPAFSADGWTRSSWRSAISGSRPQPSRERNGSGDRCTRGWTFVGKLAPRCAHHSGVTRLR